MKILITGASGFIGRHLVAYLKRCSYDVVGVDFIDGDLREEKVIDMLIATHRPTVLVHLAAQVGIYYNEQDCVHAINSNTIMTLRIAQACKRFGIKMIHTSTSEVYGDFGDRLIDENEPLIGKPTGIYALSKRWSEDAVREYANDDYVIIRPSMPYGTGVPPGTGRRAMDNMLWQAHHRKPIIVHRDSARSWCWIGDVVRGYEMIIASGETGAFNVGRDDDERTMLWLAEQCCKIAGAPLSLIKEVDPPESKTIIKRLSTDRLRGLGWRPSVELEQGMPLVYNWVKKFPWKEA